MSTADNTRARILDAATAEFAAHGIAGARVDRIAERSGMSKPMIYTYFGGKSTLFDAVFRAHVLGNGDRVPFDAADLPGYAARLYDDYLADPALVRLLMWKRLEQDGAGYLYPGFEEHDEQHLREIAAEQRAGRVRDDLAPVDLWALLIASAATWAGLHHRGRDCRGPARRTRSAAECPRPLRPRGGAATGVSLDHWSAETSSASLDLDLDSEHRPSIATLTVRGTMMTSRRCPGHGFAPDGAGSAFGPVPRIVRLVA